MLSPLCCTSMCQQDPHPMQRSSDYRLSEQQTPPHVLKPDRAPPERLVALKRSIQAKIVQQVTLDDSSPEEKKEDTCAQDNYYAAPASKAKQPSLLKM